MNETHHQVRIILLLALLPLASMSASVTDDRIESSAKQSYVFMTYLSKDTITVNSKDGEVTLSGLVADDAEKTLAQQTIESLPGVKSINNQLQLKVGAAAYSDDSRIGMKVHYVLLLHPSVQESSTVVTVHNGAVTLSGTASSSAQKELTGEYADDVEGVTDLKNNMTIVDSADGPLKLLGGRIDDASITALVKASLIWHRSTSPTHTSVQTHDGVVTLTGTAQTAAEITHVTKIAGDIHGVQSVTNNMTLRTTPLTKN